jgi:hypothetical protein
MSEFAKRWIVRFVRKDGKPDEEYYYHTQAEAEYHRNLFQDDDSGLYERIEVVNEEDE